tara:strand:- start:2395 stop:2955 length:561 start_codon:yes stop_codon:yes gene_type:complete
MEYQDMNTDDYKHFGMNDIHNMEKSGQLDMFLAGEKKKTYVKFHLHKNRLNAGDIYDYCEDLYKQENVLGKNDNLVIIVKDSFNDTLAKTLQELFLSDEIFIVIFTFASLQFNILKHVLVPKHTIVEDVESVKKKYNISDNSQFPEISRFDPVAQAIGLRPGQVCEITRQSPTAITSTYYRFCLNE